MFATWNEYNPFNDEVYQFLSKFYSPEDMKKLSRAIITPPDTSIRVNTTKLSRDQVLPMVQQILDQSGSTFLAIPHPSLADVIVIPHSGGTDPRPIELKSPEVLVSRKCAEAVLRGADVFIPGVIGQSKKICKGERVTILVDIFDRHLKGSVTSIIATGKLKPKSLKGVVYSEMSDTSYKGDDEQTGVLPHGILCIGEGIAQDDREVMMKMKEGVAVKVTHKMFLSVPSFNGVLHGLIMLQNLPSSFAAHTLHPQPGYRVIDLCASPGGKSTHIAALMNNTGQVISCDRSQGKTRYIDNLVAELELQNVTTYAIDSVRAVLSLTQDKTPLPPGQQPKKEQQQFRPESFDAVLLDPPCSALGLRPRLLVNTTVDLLQQQAIFQQILFIAAVRLLKIGGRMVYSTCTINPLENEANVAHFLQRHPVRLVPTPFQHDHSLGQPGMAGFGLDDEQRQFVRRFEPFGPGNTNGFFVACFEKIGRCREDENEELPTIQIK